MNATKALRQVRNERGPERRVRQFSPLFLMFVSKRRKEKPWSF